MSRLIPAAERINRARDLIQQARQIPVPPATGWSDFSYVAQVRDVLRQARDLIKLIGYSAGASAELKREAAQVNDEIEQAEREILHR
jgi:predicted ATP-grasp superfamily ATP-dependent carboligase